MGRDAQHQDLQTRTAPLTQGRGANLGFLAGRWRPDSAGGREALGRLNDSPSRILLREDAIEERVEFRHFPPGKFFVVQYAILVEPEIAPIQAHNARRLAVDQLDDDICESHPLTGEARQGA